MSTYRENGRQGDVFANATESVTGFAASGNPLSILSPFDAMIFLGKAKGVPMASVARLLRVSRETAYQHLRKATATLTAELAAPGSTRPRRPCRCGQPRLPGRSRCEACWRDYMRAYMRMKRGGRR